jgi:hypothetical protein
MVHKRNIEGLALGRGKKPKLGHKQVAIQMSEEHKGAVEAIAASYGCIHGGKPSLSGLLAKIGSGELLIVHAPPTPPASPSALSSQHG